MGIASTLNLASQALKAQQAAIQTTGHNVANAATPGYSRQRVALRTTTPAFENGIYLGRGVNADNVRSVVDHFAEAQLLDIQSHLGSLSAENKAIGAIEEIFPAAGGIDTALSGFFNTLTELTTNPGGAAERTAVIGKANSLGEALRLTRGQLATVQLNLDQDLQSAVHKVNSLTEEIAALNQDIAFGESVGQPANDARDRRQVRLQELANLTGVTIQEQGDGQVTVLTQNVLLVSGNRAANLEARSLSSGFHQIEVLSPDGMRFDGTGLFNKGEISGLIKSRDVSLNNAINQLDLLAKAVADQVNTQHAAGFDQTGAAGGVFFQPLATVTGAAGALQVATTVAADPKLIAAAATAAGAPGDNRNALALANLNNASVAALGSQTFQNYFLTNLGGVAETARVLDGEVQFQTTLLAQVQARREASSGVSIDEEMTNLILFQRAFEASSRMISTASELYQTLIEMTR